MHDPKVVAFNIRRPYPEKSSRGAGRTPRWKIQISRNHVSPFVTLAGREYYFPDLITVWHVEPHGEDALRGECRGTRWQWHVHHWEIQWCFIQRWRRRLLTRCEWCGGRSTKRDVVNCSHQWDGPKQSLWRGERGLFHMSCSTVALAHARCICEVPMFEQGRDYGTCLLCTKSRGWRQEPNDATRMLQTIPNGGRIPAEMKPHLDRIFAEIRASKENS
ncbi:MULTISPECIES: hypothetical protein [unclassified Rhodococcus (in: high G+C Gram-positive bacteria)]|uniref:hypothetical protein n=1 Tax=unclassified Rhodococcus (in: high G+C Gram-positive bacteria) TaxID=192944 RepID=UPI000B9C2C79|nr:MULTISPECIES: hypothetical protein [unclassified Rhodococcus (in: high G+C Gram-positive bacteria)]OZE35642.1 hypothetical protein CH259_16580 [Rhodococcus sp. 05-2254-4]OZE48071.1 hypothetical protein CH261_09175 [Rhodococcus sp. 05-2254-3]OZE49282.1 hypothetical protein CH283_16960 [Rhodococcus sp. 05-2254-2]